MAYHKEQALIVVDIQNDFLPGGNLPVPDSEFVVDEANKLMRQFHSDGKVVVATQDWHPPDHQSFASQHDDFEPYEEVELPNKAIDTVWPDHCIQGTEGSELADRLNTQQFQSVFKKGTDKHADSYSGFYDNNHVNSTGLTSFLEQRNVKDVFIVGLAQDVCVKFTALDAIRDGFNTYVVNDATKGLSKDGERDMVREVTQAGGQVITKAKIFSEE